MRQRLSWHGVQSGRMVKIALTLLAIILLTANIAGQRVAANESSAVKIINSIPSNSRVYASGVFSHVDLIAIGSNGDSVVGKFGFGSEKSVTPLITSLNSIPYSQTMSVM